MPGCTSAPRHKCPKFLAPVTLYLYTIGEQDKLHCIALEEIFLKEVLKFHFE